MSQALMTAVASNRAMPVTAGQPWTPPFTVVELTVVPDWQGPQVVVELVLESVFVVVVAGHESYPRQLLMIVLTDGKPRPPV